MSVKTVSHQWGIRFCHHGISGFVFTRTNKACHPHLFKTRRFARDQIEYLRDVTDFQQLKAVKVRVTVEEIE